MSEIVVILAFANHRNDLPNLAKERRGILDALRGTPGLKVSPAVNVSFKDIAEEFRPYPDSSGYIFHFGGHNSGDALLMEDAEGKEHQVQAKNLAIYLANTPRLKLVFLNGCTNYTQAKALQEAGVPAVVVTNQAIYDSVAADFAENFYRELRFGSTIEQAFTKAVALFEESTGEPRAARVYNPDQNEESSKLPWELYATEEGKAWSLTKALKGPTETPLPPLVFDKNPFKGMAAFQEVDAPRFYGRDEETEAVIEHIEEQAFVAVVGNSGTGKSSLVFAGVVHNLNTKQADKWVIISCKSGDNPFNNLAGPLMEMWLGKVEAAKKREAYAQDIKEQRLSLANIAKSISENNQNKRVLLIIDQYEELYTLTPSEASSQDQSPQTAFQNVLLAAVNAQPAEPFLTILITLRTDFLPHAYDKREFGALVKDATYTLLLMEGEEDIRAAIELPDKKKRPRVLLEGGLAERIISDAKGKLTLLQFAMAQLWKKDIEEKGHRQLTYETYNEMGKVQGAIQAHADEVYQELTDDEKEQVKRVMIQLVHLGEGIEDTRRVVAISSLESYRQVIAKLADARLVITSADASEGEQEEQGEVEVIHETLIQEWERLRRWIDENREFLRWQRSLQEKLKLWKEQGQAKSELLRGGSLSQAEEKVSKNHPLLNNDEKALIEQSIRQRRANRTRVIGAGGTVMVVIALLAVGLLFAYLESERQRQEAEHQKQEAERLGITAVLQNLQSKSMLYLGENNYFYQTDA